MDRKTETELLHIKMSLVAVRQSLIEELGAIEQRIECLFPEEKPVKKITDWKKEVASW